MDEERQMKLTIEVFNKKRSSSKTACAKAFDVLPQILQHHLNVMICCENSDANYKQETQKWTRSAKLNSQPIASFPEAIQCNYMVMSSQA